MQAHIIADVLAGGVWYRPGDVVECTEAQFQEWHDMGAAVPYEMKVQSPNHEKKNELSPLLQRAHH
jgi:hypothetical protein